MAATSGMSQARFEELAEAYGGDVSRWPAEAREAAAVLMAAEPEFTGQVLARAGALDAALDSWRPAPASAALTERILAAAPRPRRSRWPVWLSPAALGAGLAAACVAGVIAGVEVSDRANASEVAVTNTLNTVASPFDLEAGA
jgi:hypothetical protein